MWLRPRSTHHRNRRTDVSTLLLLFADVPISGPPFPGADNPILWFANPGDVILWSPSSFDVLIWSA